MKTEELIGLLATDAGPVPRRAGEWRFAVAMALGVAVALAWVAAEYGLRRDLAQVAATPAFWVKVAVPLAMAACGLAALFRLAHPGTRTGYWALGLVLPLLVWWGLAAQALGPADAATRATLVWGSTWRVCTLNVVATALPVGIALFWALKGLAPTRPAWTGTVAGGLAGAVGAVVYALHCPEMAAPFLAIWYVLGMALAAGIGGVAGARVLRW
ncbi:MAG: DUF1109 domain-containing protein [Rhizobacter sp.]